MIYKKEANFPYPVLSNTSDSYVENYFALDVSIRDSADAYIFDFTYELGSEFIEELLRSNRAQMFFIIKSKDNKFYPVEQGVTNVKISKTRISLSKRTSIQLHIQLLEDISFAENNELNDFYTEFKDEIYVNKFELLGYSDVIIFDGDLKKPYDLFEKKLNQDLKSDIKVELGSETIIIHYKAKELQFNDLPKSNTLNNAYIYAGLTKALQAFIMNNGEDGDVDLESIVEPEHKLDFKLYNLMKKKDVTELNTDNIDEVIDKVSDRIIERFTSAVRELDSNGS